MISNHSNVNFENRKKNRVNKMTISNSIHLQIILHYITFTDYYIVKDTFRLTSIHSNVNVEINKNNRVNKMTIFKINTLTNYTTLYHTYQLLCC